MGVGGRCASVERRPRCGSCTSSACPDWVICALAAFLGFGSHFSGSPVLNEAGKKHLCQGV